MEHTFQPSFVVKVFFLYSIAQFWEGVHHAAAAFFVRVSWHFFMGGCTGVRRIQLALGFGFSFFGIVLAYG